MVSSIRPVVGLLSGVQYHISITRMSNDHRLSMAGSTLTLSTPNTDNGFSSLLVFSDDNPTATNIYGHNPLTPLYTVRTEWVGTNAVTSVYYHPDGDVLPKQATDDDAATLNGDERKPELIAEWKWDAVKIRERGMKTESPGSWVKKGLFSR